ncbi:hypothetical protein NC653_007904 [Populus alba x Populus x berolinensis]|uniref:Uncharacterized protein n=1 Tax=Populus alba x Populus x berolinensis TaxID=444605 RepID=A0AAD6R5E2_9ROSI|nr:hypothetical protein NC653_007904 [Populus alba x Populus x berolinensis]
MTNISYRDVHDILLYGFELSWYSACCDSVNEIQYCNYDSTYCDSYGLNGAPIRVAIDFLTNRILSYLIFGPITKCFPSGTWIYYSRREDELMSSCFHMAEYYTYVGTKTISSDFLRIIIVVLIALLIFTGKYFPMLLWIRCRT